MRNFKRKFTPTTSFSSYGDLKIGKFRGGVLATIVVLPVLWLMYQYTSHFYQDTYPKVFCQEDICTFTFENGRQKQLARDEVPFDEKGYVEKDKIIWP